MEAVVFKNRKSEILKGFIVGSYPAFEGGMRYIIQAIGGKEYRCVKDSKGWYVEFVA